MCCIEFKKKCFFFLLFLFLSDANGTKLAFYPSSSFRPINLNLGDGVTVAFSSIVTAIFTVVAVVSIATVTAVVAASPAAAVAEHKLEFPI